MPEKPSADVLAFPGDTVAEMPAEKILNGALQNGVQGPLCVLGYDADDQFYFAATTSHPGDLLLLLERARKFIQEKML